MLMNRKENTIEAITPSFIVERIGTTSQLNKFIISEFSIKNMNKKNAVVKQGLSHSVLSI